MLQVAKSCPKRLFLSLDVKIDSLQNYFMILHLIMNLISILFSYRMSKKIRAIRDTIYAIWIGNFIGSLPKDSTVAYPCSLQGGGEKNIFIGHGTIINGHSILGCWAKYGKNQLFTPSITIGNSCNIGEYTQFSSCCTISIGDGLLTGRYVYIGDNSHGGLSLRRHLFHLPREFYHLKAR